MADEAFKMNDESEKLMTSLLDISDFVLLHVFSYLNLRDSINFAETCVRLSKVGEMNFTKYKKFDLFKYEHLVYVLEDNYNRYAYHDDEEDEDEDENGEDIEESEPIEVENVLSHIGKHIETLSINSTRQSVEKAVTDNCVNVTSLKILEIYHYSSEWKTWMNNLNLEKLTIQNCDNFTEMSVPLATLKELKFTGSNNFLDSTELINILEKTPELESLQVELYYTDFKYDIFDKLPKLRSLYIKIHSEDLVKLTEFLKFDVLTQFKIFLPYFINDDGAIDDKGLNILNSFLELLAAKGNLNELGLFVSHVDKNTFRALKLFHVTSLRFCTLTFLHHCAFHDDCMINELVQVHQQSNLKHLDFLKKSISIEHAILVLKKLVKLETFTFRMEEDLDRLTESKIDEILKTSSSRPMLTLYVNLKKRNSVKITVRHTSAYKH